MPLFQRRLKRIRTGDIVEHRSFQEIRMLDDRCFIIPCWKINVAQSSNHSRGSQAIKPSNCVAGGTDRSAWRHQAESQANEGRLVACSCLLPYCFSPLDTGSTITRLVLSPLAVTGNAWIPRDQPNDSAILRKIHEMNFFFSSLRNFVCKQAIWS